MGAGLAIAEAIAGIGKPTLSFVAGHAHSIGLPIAVATQESFMAPAARILIHPVSRTGIILGVPHSLVEIQREQQLIDFVYRHSHLREGTYEPLMSATQGGIEPGTFLTAGDCVERGLIDYVGSLREALLRLHELIGGAAGVSHSSNAGRNS